MSMSLKTAAKCFVLATVICGGADVGTAQEEMAPAPLPEVAPPPPIAPIARWAIVTDDVLNRRFISHVRETNLPSVAAASAYFELTRARLHRTGTDAQPSVEFVLPLREGVDPADPLVTDAATAVARDFLNDDLLAADALNALRDENGEPRIVLTMKPLSEMAIDWFAPPTGLTMPVERLLWETGFLHTSHFGEAIPYTHTFCMDVAVKCYVEGRHTDSLAFVNRANELAVTPAGLYLTALNQLALGDAAGVTETANLLKANRTYDTRLVYFRERFAGPRGVRLEALLRAATPVVPVR